MSVNVGAVETWDTGCMVREQAIKVLEEAAEVFGAFERHEAALDAIEREWPREQCDVKHRHREEARESKDALKDECADVITATCNLLAMLGVEDATEIMEARFTTRAGSSARFSNPKTNAA